MHNEDLKQSRDLALPLIGVGIKRVSVAGDKAEALLPRRGDDDGLEVGEEMHAAPNSCRYSWLTTVIGFMQKVEDSRTENSQEDLFVALAVYLWTEKTVRCLLADEECFALFRRCVLVLA